LPRIEDSFRRGFPTFISLLPEETAPIPKVASAAALLFDAQEQGVVVAIDQNIFDLLIVAGLFAF
jgi:hypothetical protein